MSTDACQRALTVRDIAERYSVDVHTVLTWIRRGELPALDVSRCRGRKPRWRVTPEGLAEFVSRRMASPPPPRSRQRKKESSGVIKFY